MSRFGACSARISGDTHTDTHTDTQNDYRNPRCACAPRVNEGPGHKTTPINCGETRGGCISRYSLGLETLDHHSIYNSHLLTAVSREISILAFSLMFHAVTPERSHIGQIPLMFICRSVCMFVYSTIACSLRVTDTHTNRQTQLQ